MLGTLKVKSFSFQAPNLLYSRDCAEEACIMRVFIILVSRLSKRVSMLFGISVLLYLPGACAKYCFYCQHLFCINFI